ncbi:MAG: hypothetical protein ACT4NU_09135 [Chromatiales bacterium]
MSTISRALLFALTLGLLVTACGRREGEGKAAAGDATPLPSELIVPSADEAATAAAPQGGNAPIAMPTAVDPLLADAQSRAASIDAGRPGLTVQSRQQVIGEIKTDVSVYYSGQQVVLVEEKVQTVDNSQSINRYYFDNGSLYLYEDDGRWLDVNPPNPLVTKTFKRAMVFNPTGKLVTAAKSVDGVPAGLGEYEAVAVLGRVNELLGDAARPVIAPPPEVAAAAAPEVAPVPAAGSEASQPADTPAAVTAAQPPASKEPVGAAAAPAEPAKQPQGAGQRVSLADGESSTQVRGTAPAHGTRDYVVRARAGQLMTLSLEGAPKAVFAVYSTRGEIVADLTNWSSKMPRDEDYTIKVGQTGGAAAPAEFVLNIKIE